jgi:hypothetical protein
VTELDPATERATTPVSVARSHRTDHLNGLPEPKHTQRSGGERDEHIQRLEVRLTRLEQLLWGTESGDSELDLVDPELTRLAEAAESAHELTRLLAAPEVRSACEQAIHSWEQWHRRHREVLEIGLSASRTIAITSADQRGRADVVREFDAARTELADLQSRRQGCLNAATHASRQLERDQDVRDRSQGDIDAGHLAWTTLNARLRMRITTAVEHAQPLPAWLVVALGPASATGPAQWRELAIELLAYRITYSVSDTVAPLGAEPTADDSPRRRRWYAELGQQLARWVEVT